MSGILRVELFGGVRVTLAGGEIAVPHTRAGALLAALVLARGNHVSAADLKGLLWSGGAPSSASNQLHRLIGQVRRLFEPELSPRDVGHFIAGSGTGYRLDPAIVSSDVWDCESAVEAARTCAESDDLDSAVTHYLHALELVGRPLLGDPTWESAGLPEFSAVARLRLVVAGESLACARQVGRLGEVVALVEPIGEGAIFEEALQADLMRALTQAGRRRDAMRLFERVRTALVEELGVDPGPELRAAQDELLSVGADEPAAPGRSTGFPAQLPSALRGMTPRPEAQVLLDEVARLGEAEAVVITAIGGMGGIGKTTLAVAWARSIADRFPDGQLYVNLRGFDPEGQVTTAMDALGELLLSLGVAPVDGEETLSVRSARFRNVVADRRMLLLLDNARDAEQVRPLLPGGDGCLVIVTSRNHLPSLVVREGAVPVRLDRMTDDQARDLLTHRLGEARVGREAGAAERIIQAAAGLPLALAIVAARLAVDPDLGLDQVADDLAKPADEGSRLPGWSTGEAGDDLASVFDWSYELLDPESARAFRRLAVHPGLEISQAAAAGITDLDPTRIRHVTARLVGASLLERRGPERFAIHDLLRDYAASRLQGEEQRDAEARIVGHYVASTRNAWSVFGRPPVGELDEVAELPGLEADRFATGAESIEWYLREKLILRDVLHLAVRRGWDRAAANIAIDWRPMNQAVDVDAHTYPHAKAALAAAERTGDPVLRAELHRECGTRATHLGQAVVGREHLEVARRLFAELGDRTGEANVLRNLATVVSRDEGIGLLREAAALVSGGEAPQVFEVIRVTLGARLLYVDPGETVSEEDYLQAVDVLSASMEVLLAEGWIHLIPSAADALAEALMQLSRPADALRVAIEASPYASQSPVDLLFLHVVVAEAAMASNEHAIAAQACRDFRDLIETEGRTQIDRMLVTANHPVDQPFTVIERVETALSRQVSSTAQGARRLGSETAD